MNEWNLKFSDNYMTTKSLNRIFEDQRKFEKNAEKSIKQINAILEEWKDLYVQKHDMEYELKRFAEVEAVQELEVKMKQLPTEAGIDQRFKAVKEKMQEH